MSKKNKKNKSKIEKILTAIATFAYAGVIFTESKKLYDEAQAKKKAKM